MNQKNNKSYKKNMKINENQIKKKFILDEVNLLIIDYF